MTSICLQMNYHTFYKYLDECKPKKLQEQKRTEKTVCGLPKHQVLKTWVYSPYLRSDLKANSFTETMINMLMSALISAAVER